MPRIIEYICTHAPPVLSPDITENRTTFRGVSSDEAESSSECVVGVGAKFFLGSSSRMPNWSFEKDMLSDRVDVEALRFDLGVDGVVDVNVDSDAFESDGVSVLELREGVEGGSCFFSEERAGGGGRMIAGADPRLACDGRVTLLGGGMPRGLSGVSDCRDLGWYALDEDPR